MVKCEYGWRTMGMTTEKQTRDNFREPNRPKYTRRMVRKFIRKCNRELKQWKREIRNNNSLPKTVLTTERYHAILESHRGE